MSFIYTLNIFKSFFQIQENYKQILTSVGVIGLVLLAAKINLDVGILQAGMFSFGFFPFFVLGGDGGGGSDGGSTSAAAAGGVTSMSVSGTGVTVSFGNGATFSGSMSANGTFSCSNGLSFSGVGENSNASTPFLMVWNGENYAHENDFLFGKPNTAFADYKSGLKAYAEGIGGDTYLLSSALKVNEQGELKLQIRELEPEESFIDQFELFSLDLKKSEHYVVDGNLTDSYVFDASLAKIVSSHVVQHFHKSQNTFTEAKITNPNLAGGESDQEITMQKDDELVITIPKSAINDKSDTFILVDSYYRDWSIGNQVPFSLLERFSIGSMALGRTLATTAAGITLLATAAVTSIFANDTQQNLQKLVAVPYAHADFPYTGPGGTVGRSLVVSVQDGSIHTYLQTLFPRYVQASQEVVRIPKKIINSLKGEFLTVRVKATKKHKVRSAFVFSGKAQPPELTPLTIESAVARADNSDYSTRLAKKDGDFLATVPGDVVDLTIKDSAKQPDTTRRYVLKAKGFYTRLSAKTYHTIGANWINSLSNDDRRLLKRLRVKV